MRRHGVGRTVTLLIGSGLIATSPGPPPPGRPTTPPPSGGAAASAETSLLGSLPLAFEEVVGGDDPTPHYSARGPGYLVRVSPTEAALTLQQPVAGGETAAVRLSLLGSAPAAPVRGVEKLGGTVNYLRGGDPTRWTTGLPTYASVMVPQAYPGIDVVYYGNQGRMEYDFRLAPRADPDSIRVGVEGASIGLEASGELTLSTPLATVRQPPPAAYQEIGGRRAPVDAGYVLDGAGGFRFRLGDYDRAHPLVIDPLIDYSTLYAHLATGVAIATDGSGNAYIAGYTPWDGITLHHPRGDVPLKNAFDPDGGPFDQTEGFVAKLSPTGLVYSSYVGGSSYDFARGIAADRAGNAYVTGETSSGDFPLLNPIAGATGGGFALKLAPTGALAYSTRLGDGGNAAIDADENGYAYVTGGNGLHKLGPTGQLVYSRTLSGTGLGVATDEWGSAYVTGQAGTGFPLVNAFDATAVGEEAFVTKFDPGGTIEWSTYLGGSGNDKGYGIAADPARNIFVTGTTTSADFPIVGAFDTTVGGQDGFVVRMTPAGGLRYSTYLGGTKGATAADGDGADYAYAIATDGIGNAYVTGVSSSPDFPIFNAFNRRFPYIEDAFVTKLDPIGRLVYSTFVGGSRFGDLGYGIAVDRPGVAYVVGATNSPDFPIRNPPPTAPSAGGINESSLSTFVMRLAPCDVAGVRPKCFRPADFDRDRKTDVAVYRPSNFTWYLRTTPNTAVPWGTHGDIPVAGDYDGNGTSDPTLYRPSNSTWYVRNGTPAAIAWGTQGDIPVPGDYDGDGDTDTAVFRPSNSTWYLNTPTPQQVTWGTTNDIPVPGDYDGDGRTDLAVFRPSDNTWRLRTTTPTTYTWGAAGDIPVPADYDGDGDVDPGVFRRSTGTWSLMTGTPYFGELSATTIQLGANGDLPVPGDYDGDGDADPAVFRRSTGTWFLFTPRWTLAWGTAGDIPVALPYAIYRAFFLSPP